MEQIFAILSYSTAELWITLTLFPWQPEVLKKNGVKKIAI